MASLRDILASGSESFRRLNRALARPVRAPAGKQTRPADDLGATIPVPVPQPNGQPALDGDPKTETGSENKAAQRPRVDFTLFRVQLLDKDNSYSAVKYMLDALTYAGLIPGDRIADIDLTVKQEKVSRRQEGTSIIITY